MTRREALLALTLGRLFPRTAYLLMDPASRQLIASHWNERGNESGNESRNESGNAPDTAAPMGSLMKPLVALAHGAPFPEFDCQGCWKPYGHGRLGLTEALAQSCNSYFLALARTVSPEAIARVAGRYGLPPPTIQTPEAWIGFGVGWEVPPAGLLSAYCELDPVVMPGLRRSAERGTARAFGGDAYAKTGTGPCTHYPKGNGDGFAIALFPAETPRYALLVSAHNQPGSEAARIAGKMRREIR